MAIDTSQFRADLTAMVGDLPAVLTAAFLTSSPQNVSCAELTAEVALILTGDQSKKAFQCTLDTALCSRDPKNQERVQIQGQGEAVATNYQVMRLLRAADGVAFTLYLIQDPRKP